MIQTIFDKINSFSARKICFILFAIGFVVYIPSLFNGFVWDDTPQIVQNLVIQNIGYIGRIFTSSTFYPGTGSNLVGSYYKPLMPLAFMLLHAAFGLNPFFYHLVDVIMHGLNVVLLFIFFKKTLEYAKSSHAKVIAFFLALLFLIHPVNIESVAYISSTQEVFYVFFMLVALLLTFSIKEKVTLIKFFMLSLSLLASILSKESGIIGFPLVVLFAFVIRMPKKKQLVFTVGVTLIVYFILRFGFAHLSPISGNPLIPIQVAPLSTRLLTIPYEIVSYLRLFLFPKDLFIYQDDLVKTMSDQRFFLLFPIALLVPLVMLILFIKNKNSLFRFFLVWIFFSSSLVLNIIPLDMTIAERWMYGPFIGILGCLSIWLSAKSEHRQRLLKVVIIILIILTPFYLLRDITRELQWYNNEVLYTNDLRYEKQSARLLNDLGVAFAAKGDNKRAEAYFKESLQQAPYQFQAYDNLGLLYNQIGDYQTAQLSFIAALGHGALASTYVNYAAFLSEHGHTDEAISFIKRAILIFPQSYELYANLALAYRAIGKPYDAALAQQKADEYMPIQLKMQQQMQQQEIPLR